MDRSDPGSVRAEAERLVVTALAAARSLVSAGPVAHFAEDAACCSCPVCRGIRVLREPSPEFAERLASGAGDLAAGVASLLRSFNPGSAGGPGAPRSRPAPEAGETEPEGADSGGHYPEGPREAASAEAETAKTADAGAGGGSAGFGNEADRRGAAGGGPGPDAERDVLAAATRAEAGRDDDAGGRGERQR